MNYKSNYYDYVKYVQTLNRSKSSSIYYEEHHIVPRSLGGLNTPDNKVLLTAREHYLAHYLLMKIYENEDIISYRKMVNAFICMNWNKYGKRYLNSRLYERARITFSKNQTDVFSDKDSDNYKAWYYHHALGMQALRNKESQKYRDWQKAIREGVPQLRAKTSQEYKTWYRNLQESKPSNRDKSSPEYRNWYKSLQENKPSNRDKQSLEYIQWHTRYLEGRKNLKLRWIHNLELNQCIMVRSEQLDEYIAKGWKKGRLVKHDEAQDSDT